MPFYARFAATLNQYFPEVGNELVAFLLNEFESITDQQEAISPQAKIKNVRFIGELVKFRLIGTTHALDCLKKCLDNFIGSNIDLVSNLLETAGPFLVNSLDEAVRLRVQNLLDYMWRLKEKETMSSMQSNSLESSYYL